MSPEVGFHAIGAGDRQTIRLLGYEDVKSRFYRPGADQCARQSDWAWRAAARPRRRGPAVRLRALRQSQYRDRCAGRRRAESSSSTAGRATWASRPNGRPLSRHGVGRAGILDAALSRHRKILAPPTPAEHRFAFSADGRSLMTTHGTPRPFAHVIANSLGLGAVLTNDGDIFSFSGNSRLNSFTPFRLGEGRMAPAGQAIYV